MDTLQKLYKVRSGLSDDLKLLEEARQEVDEQIQLFKQHNTELPRKAVARMIGCTENYVSHLKAQGRLKSYRYRDVITYIKTH